MRSMARVAVAAAIVGLLVVVPAAPRLAAQATPTQACRRLAALSLPETTIKLTEVVSGSFTPPDGTPAISNLPSFCRVWVVVAPQINVEVWLPAGSWNGRFQGVGGGGMAGNISYPALAAALRDGYATASTDTGHTGTPLSPAPWAYGRPDLVADFGYRAVHEMTVQGKAITQAFYGSAPRRAYWNGCSTGGRQGLMEVQRYPEDYDGVLAGAPAINWSILHAWQLWNAQATLIDPDSYITPEQYAAINAAILDAWDEQDGVADGVIDDPRRVVPDFALLQAAADLSPKQLAALEKLYAGPSNSAGEPIYPGLMPGGETGWQPVVGGPEPFPIGVVVYRDLVFEDPNWDWRTLDFDTNPPLAKAKIGEAMDAMNPDLSAFQAHGGKLILYHGWSDPLISPENTRVYYESVIQAIGGLTSTAQFARLFLVPGMGHCRGGPAPDSFDSLGALVQWVEAARAPERLVAAHLTGGVVDRTRPLCPYPQVARWTGQGSTDEAANFTCVAAEVAGAMAAAAPALRLAGHAAAQVPQR